MSSAKSSPAPRRGNDRILTIDWSLLWRRARVQMGQFFTSLRHRAARTEYIPPAWLQKFRLTWFRAGLMLLALFVFTQKQVDFTVSVGKEGIAMGNSSGRHMASGQTSALSTSSMALLPGSVGQLGSSAVSVWTVNTLDADAVRSYIGRFTKVAQGEEKKFNIPAPASMALAILLSDAGQSPAAERDNNHFALVGENVYYDNAWMNWRAHSEYISRHFPKLANDSVNYQQWVAALAKTNYSSDKRLTNKLLDIIEHFGLEDL